MAADTLRQQLSDARVQEAEHKSEIRNLRQQSSTLSDIHKYMERIESENELRIKIEMDDLKRQLSDARTEKHQIQTVKEELETELNTKICSYQEEIKNLSEQMNTRERTHLKELSEKAKAYEEEIKKCKLQGRAFLQERIKAHGEETLIEDDASTEDQIQKLKVLREKDRLHIANLQARFDGLQKNYANLKTMANAMEAQHNEESSNTEKLREIMVTVEKIFD